MAIVNTHYGFCARGAAVKFTYTGEYNVRDDGVVELLTSGTIVFLEPTFIDVFCVGGGARGGVPALGSLALVNGNGSGGGGGGYTTTGRELSVSGSYKSVVGAGAENYGEAGGISSFGDLVHANGGVGITAATTGGSRIGGNGGSGGGGGVASNSDLGAGGSDGANGEKGLSGNFTPNGGAGQGTTTREFGEASGKLYSGGGGGGRYIYSQTPVTSMGGIGGGGSGGWVGGQNLTKSAGAGGANTGGGGGGGACYAVPGANTVRVEGGSGGSGIVCFRVAK